MPREVFRPPAVLVLLPTFAIVAQAQTCNRRVEISLGVYRFARQRLGVGLQRFLQARQLEHRVATIEMSADDMGLDAECLFVTGNSLFKAIQQAQRDAAVGKRDRVVRLDRQRLLIAGQCLVEVLILYACVAAVDESADIRGLARDHRVEAGECFVDAIEIEQCGAAIDFDVGANCGLQCCVVARQGLCMAAKLAKDDPAGIECVRLPRLLSETFIAGNKRFLQAIEPQ